MSDVFISYSRKDKAFVQILHDALEASNRETWVDWENIPKGTEWWQQIEAGIEGANTFIFVISPESVASSVCGNEINHAIKNGKRFLPIVRRDVEFSQFEDINPSHQDLKAHNWLFFREEDIFEQSFADLVKSLETDIDYVQQHTEFLREALKWEHNKRNDSFLLQGEELLGAEKWLEDAEARLEKTRLAENVKKKDPNPLLTEQQRNFIRKSRENEDARVKAAQILQEAKKKADLEKERAEREKEKANKAKEKADLERERAEREKEKADLERERAEREKEKANKWIKIGSGFLMVFLIAALIAGFNADKQTKIANEKEERAKKAENRANESTQKLLSKEKELVDVENKRKEIAAKAQQVQTNLEQAGKKLTSAQTQLDRAQQQKELAQKAAEQAGQDKNIAKASLKQANQDLRSATEQKARATADLDAVKIAKQKIEQQKAETELQRQATAIEVKAIQSEALVNQNRPFDALLLALKTGDEMQRLETKSFDAKTKQDAVWKSRLALRLALIQFQSNFMESDRLLDHIKEVNSVVITPDGKTLISGSKDGTIKIWDLKTRKVEKTLVINEAKEEIYSLLLSKDGKTLISGSADKTIKIWDLETRKLRNSLQADPKDKVFSLALSLDGKTLISGQKDGIIKIWDLRTGYLQKTLNAKERVRSLALSADGETLYSSAGEDGTAGTHAHGTIKIWNIKTGLGENLSEGKDGSISLVQ